MNECSYATTEEEKMPGLPKRQNGRSRLLDSFFLIKGVLISVLRELNVYVQKRNSRWRRNLRKVSGKSDQNFMC